MSNNLTLFDKILRGNLIPWLEKNKPDERFAALISELKDVEPVFPHQYEIDFYRLFNKKTSYYHKLITNESTAYCNKIHHLVNEDNNFSLLKYWRNDTLNKKIPTRLKEIGKLIKSRQLFIDYIDPHKLSFDIDTDHKTDTYIIQLLKVSYIRVFLEIQNFFPFIPKDELLIEDDFYTRFLFEPIPEKSFLAKPKPIIEIKSDSSSKKIPHPKPAELLCLSFTYKQNATAPDKLTDLCDSLKKNHFIAEDTLLSNFKKVFSGKQINEPIIWTGNPSDFRCFIQLLYTKHKLVEDLKQNHLKVACKCFTQSGGVPFDRAKLRGLKKPKLTFRLLENAVKLIM